MKWTLLTLFALAVATTGYTCDEKGETGIVEDNDLYISVDAKSVNSMTEQAFNNTISKVEKFFGDIVANKGGTLKVVRNWDDGTVNAFAKRTGDNEDVWEVHMFGGLARHETITEDGFALVVCHELGHHLGGAPRKTKWGGELRWASNEGQSDYWGTSKCLRKVFDEDSDALNKERGLLAPAHVQKECKAKYTGTDAYICMRTAMAGRSLAYLFSSLRDQTTKPQFDKPDSSTVTTTYHSHPMPQCRLDTYYRASLCTRGIYEDVSQDDPNVGICNRDAGEEDASRPLCWYNPADFKKAE